ncbi:MAG: hypothetical protein CSYNP_02554 [Syntrophus sp. SKADARSKE-3]|nr:hypothetical protein [Syntrophus sp. SKADARSKE-3]
MRQKLIDKMKDTFGDDTKRIDHAFAVLELAEKIQAAEGGDLMIVQAAAILHDIGIQEAYRKYGSTAGVHQEIEGPPIADTIMKSLGIDEEARRHVCLIVGSHHSGDKIDTPEFRCIWDADWIVNLNADYAEWPLEKKQHIINKRFRTETGKRIARTNLGVC